MLSGNDPIERTNYAAQQRDGSQPGDDDEFISCVMCTVGVEFGVRYAFKPLLRLTD